MRSILPAFVLSLGLASSAYALPNGIAAEGCSGCHNPGGLTGSLSLALSPDPFAPGALVNGTVTLASDNASVAGMYITTDDVGTLSPASGGGLKLVGSGLVHDGPRALSNGSAEFKFTFRAPSSQGGVRFGVYALAANGNGNSGGDTGVEKAFSRVYGCEGQEYFHDSDGDGHGGMLSSFLACKGAPPANTAVSNDDCNDYDADVHPGAEEKCDQVDNNCNGQVDENSTPVELWPDPDGDGHYQSKTGEPMLGCVGTEGYAAEGGDCAPNDATIHDGADEKCNFVDDDCDGRIDERARPTCGEGWCRRESESCSDEFCTPGEPVSETCNYQDDDCDGLTDEGSLCGDGRCIEGSCVAAGTVIETDAGVVAGMDGGAAQGGDPPGKTGGSSGGGCTLGRRHLRVPLGMLALLGVLWRARRRRRAS